MSINNCTCNANDQMPGKWHDEDCLNHFDKDFPPIDIRPKSLDKPKRVRKPKAKKVIDIRPKSLDKPKRVRKPKAKKVIM